MRLTIRVHEFLADHISWVQYPGVREVRQPRAIDSPHIPALTRLALALYALVVIPVSCVLLFLLLGLAWAMIS